MAGNLGRISGHLLKENLLRNGNDLAFDTDLLYLKVTPVITPFEEDGEYGDPNFDSTLPASLQGTGVGVNIDVPVYDLDISTESITTNSIVDNQANISNIIVKSNSYFTTTVGPIILAPNWPTPGSPPYPYIRHDRVITDDLEFNDNTIRSLSSNQSIELRPNASGTIELIANTNVTGDLYVTGDINITGNLTKQGNLILGDDVIDEEGDVKENDTVDFNVDFQQSFIPGLDNAYDLGRDKDDSSFGRWRQVYTPDWTNITNINPESVRVSDQIIVNGVDNEIFALQSNDDVSILPNNGYTFGDYIRTFNASDETAKERYGHAVAVNSTYMATSSWSASPNTVYVYNATTGETVYTIVNPTGDDTDHFGYAIDMNDDYLAITALNADVNTGDAAGKVYVYELATGTLHYTISNPDPSVAIPRDFGYSVGVSDSYLIVGAPASNLASSTSDTYHTGEVRIYNIDNGSLVRTIADPGSSRPHPSSTYVNSWFGRAVDVAETYAIVGAPGMEYLTRIKSGEIHVYNISTGVRTRNIDNPFFNSTYYEDDEWGFAVATTDTYFAAGGPDQNFGGQVELYRHSGGTVFSVRTTDLGYSIDLTDDYMVVGNGNGSAQARIYDTAGNLLFEFENDYTDFDSGPASSLFENGRDVAISGSLIAISIASQFTGSLDQGRIIVINAADTATYVEDLEFKENNITNLLNTPITFTGTNRGYYKFDGTNAFVLPAGDDASRPSSPEIGDTRWNTDQGYLECFDGSIYVIATGAGEEVTEEIQEDLANVYTLILG